ncbi:MAG TPA: archease [Methanocorpusculum sp.]|nr:archease [Methanocorpusculum sp.]HJJ45972.1 archease [Methanocorpusculum sp.]
MPFEELEHTADVKMRITASDYSLLLAESGFALSQVMYGKYNCEPSEITVSIEAEGTTPAELCVNFLSELLFIMETEYLVPSAFSLAADETSVAGTVSGIPFERGKHSGGIEVKGISYSGLTLTKTNTEYELIIIFDI